MLVFRVLRNGKPYNSKVYTNAGHAKNAVHAARLYNKYGEFTLQFSEVNWSDSCWSIDS